jgi:signal transduction histidine kinase
MLFEILKNSLRATVETHGMECENFPPVKVIVSAGKEDITIKISDEGGGIPRSAIPLVWTYMFAFIRGYDRLSGVAGTRRPVQKTWIKTSKGQTSKRP